MTKGRNPARVTDVEGYDALLAPGVRALRERGGDAAAVQALASKLEAALGSDVVAGSAVAGGAKALLLRFTLLGVVGLGVGTGLWWALDAERAHRYVVVQEAPVEVRAAPVVPELPELKPAAKVEPTQPAARVRTKAKATPPAAQDPEAELALLGRAQTLLGRDARASLQLLDQHAQTYPKGVFREEREVMALEAEQKLGRKVDASARAERFIATFPRSAHARRVRALLEPAP